MCEMTYAVLVQIHVGVMKDKINIEVSSVDCECITWQAKQKLTVAVELE